MAKKTNNGSGIMAYSVRAKKQVELEADTITAKDNGRGSYMIRGKGPDGNDVTTIKSKADVEKWESEGLLEIVTDKPAKKAEKPAMKKK